jgi:hypothetical protein
MNIRWKKIGRILGRQDPRIVYEALIEMPCGRCDHTIEAGDQFTLERRVLVCCSACSPMQAQPTVIPEVRQHRGGRPRLAHAGHMLSPDAVRLLDWLRHAGEGLHSVSNEELSLHIRRRPSTIQRVLQELERAGLIRRHWDVSRRVRMIELLADEFETLTPAASPPPLSLPNCEL